MVQLERRLAKAIPDSGEFFGIPGKVSHESLSQEYWATKAALDSNRVTYEMKPKLAARRKHLPAIADLVSSGDIKAPNCGSDWLFQIRSIAGSTDSNSGNPMNSAFNHPRAQSVLDRLEKIGTVVYADPTLNSIGWGGAFDPVKRTVNLPANSNFLTLIHEGGHAEFAHFRIHEFIKKIKKEGIRPGFLEKLLTKSPHSGFGRQRLLKVMELTRLGYPENSIDELLAVEAEKEEMKSSGFEDLLPNFSGTKYARWHLLNDLASLSLERPLNQIERATFLKAIFENLVDPDVGNLQKQFRYGRRLARLIEKSHTEPGQIPEFSDTRLATYRRREALRGSIGLGSAATSLGLALFYHQALAQFVLMLTNGTVVQVDLPPENEDEEKVQTDENKTTDSP